MEGKTLTLDVRGPSVNIQPHYLLVMQFLAKFLRYLVLSLPLCEMGIYLYFSQCSDRDAKNMGKIHFINCRVYKT